MLTGREVLDERDKPDAGVAAVAAAVQLVVPVRAKRGLHIGVVVVECAVGGGVVSRGGELVGLRRRIVEVVLDGVV